jgi:dTDP-4-dehydrorhamnose 3,5-epimerase
MCRRGARGLVTMEAESEVFYQMSEFYDAETSRGVTLDDPAFEIGWQEYVEVISE